MARKLALLLALLFVVAGGCGCTGERQEEDMSVNINEQALSYMEEKYGEPFLYARATGDSMSGTHTLMVSCESLPGREIQVEIANFRSENPVFMDNYLAIKYEADTRSFLRTCAENAFGNAEVFYSASAEGQSASLPSDADFYEYLADRRASLNATVEVNGTGIDPAELDKQCYEFGALVSRNGSKFYLTVVGVSSEEFGALDERDVHLIIGRETFLYCGWVSNFDEEIKVVRDGT